MRRALLAAGALALASACGFPTAPPMAVGSSCAFDDTSIEIEVGSPASCDAVAAALQAYRAEYEAKFGRQDLTSRVIRYRVTQDLATTSGDPIEGGTVGGRTYIDAIDLASTCLECLPHELNHVRRGTGHAGWCVDYNPWSIAVLGWDQSDYLGCR